MLSKTKIDEKRQQYEAIAKAYLLSLRDIRNVGSLAFIVMVLLISWSGMKAIQTNYGLQRQVERMRQENAIRKLENSNMELRNYYYGTSQYLEVTARQNFGLASPGETVLLVTEQAALARTKTPPDQQTTRIVAKQLPAWQNNFRDWINFFFHRAS